MGASSALGSWDPSAGLPLEWAEGDDWVGETALSSGSLGFKVRLQGEPLALDDG